MIKFDQIKKISKAGNIVNLKAVVKKIIQTGGPTVFIVTDGTGNFSLKGFIKPGERAYPEIIEGSAISATIKTGEFKGELEGQINSISILSEIEKNEVLTSIKEIELKKIDVKDIDFLVKSE